MSWGAHTSIDTQVGRTRAGGITPPRTVGMLIVSERARESPRQDRRGDSLVEDQWIVNGAEAATSYGVVSFLFNWMT